MSKVKNLFFSIKYFSKKSELPVSLDKLINYKPINIFNINAKNDLLIRLSKRATELENLPYGLSAVPSMELIINWYIESFLDINNINLNCKTNIKNSLSKIYLRHENTNFKISEALKELKQRYKYRYNHDINIYELNNLSSSLDAFFTNRLSVRILIDHYLNYDNQNDDYVGVVCKNTNIENILYNVIEDVTFLSNKYYDFNPIFKIINYNNNTLPFIPSYLNFVFTELLKNSVKATFDNKNFNKPITIVIGGKDRISIKISDRGDGICYSQLYKIWKYSYTTSENNFYTDNFNQYNPYLISGFGCGLPLSRAIIKFFGGDIKLMSIKGYGTDVYINL